MCDLIVKVIATFEIERNMTKKQQHWNKRNANELRDNQQLLLQTNNFLSTKKEKQRSI